MLGDAPRPVAIELATGKRVSIRKSDPDLTVPAKSGDLLGPMQSGEFTFLGGDGSIRVTLTHPATQSPVTLLQSEGEFMHIDGVFFLSDENVAVVMVHGIRHHFRSLVCVELSRLRAEAGRE